MYRRKNLTGKTLHDEIVFRLLLSVFWGLSRLTLNRFLAQRTQQLWCLFEAFILYDIMFQNYSTDAQSGKYFISQTLIFNWRHLIWFNITEENASELHSDWKLLPYFKCVWITTISRSKYFFSTFAVDMFHFLAWLCLGLKQIQWQCWQQCG